MQTFFPIILPLCNHTSFLLTYTCSPADCISLNYASVLCLWYYQLFLMRMAEARNLLTQAAVKHEGMMAGLYSMASSRSFARARSHPGQCVAVRHSRAHNFFTEDPPLNIIQTQTT